ncbi:hypothetical protein BGX27_008748 [Mortierella sp. AM989]|nr:hypothetical protein BGX27_008748 [Mortierella sp. AM989]
MASGFRGSTSPIAEAFESDETSSFEDCFIDSDEESPLLDLANGYQSDLEGISEVEQPQSSYHRSTHAISTSSVDFSSKPASTRTSLSAAIASFWSQSSQVPPLRSHPGSAQETEVEYRYFNRDGLGKRPEVSHVPPQIAMVTGMSARVYNADQESFDWDSFQIHNTFEDSCSKIPPQQQQQQQQWAPLHSADPYAEHYSASCGRVLLQTPISYHHFNPRSESVHEPQLRRSTARASKASLASRNAKATSRYAPIQPVSQAIEKSSSRISSSEYSDSPPHALAYPHSSPSMDSACSKPSALKKPLSQPKVTFPTPPTSELSYVNRLDSTIPSDSDSRSFIANTSVRGSQPPRPLGVAATSPVLASRTDIVSTPTNHQMDAMESWNSGQRDSKLQSNIPFLMIPAGPVFLGPNPSLVPEPDAISDGGPNSEVVSDIETTENAETRQVRNRSFGHRLREAFLLKSKKKK